MTCSARRDGAHYVLEGEKTWISNGGIADFYCVFARTTPGERRADGTTGAQGISAFVVEAADPGLQHRRAHRTDRAAPACAAALQRLPHTGRAADRRRGRGLQDRDAYAGRVPHLGGCRRCRVRARALERGARARANAADVRRARSRTFS